MHSHLIVLFSLQTAAAPDTIRIEVGSPRLDGRVYLPHAAQVRVRLGDSARIVSTWTNELTLGDSGGRPVMRWVSKSSTWELRQIYDAQTLAPKSYVLTASNGSWSRLTIDGRQVRGTRRGPGDTASVQQVDVTLDRAGFFAGASDLVPLAVQGGLSAGAVITAPVWSPGMTAAEGRIFTTVGRDVVDVEGTRIEAWKVEERRQPDRVLLATWWLLDKSPYMVYGEVPLPNGRVRKMTEVEIPE